MEKITINRKLLTRLVKLVDDANNENDKDKRVLYSLKSCLLGYAHSLDESFCVEVAKEEAASSAIETQWTNPETKAKQEIKIDIQEKIRFFQDFYERNLNLQIDSEEILGIWQANYVEIKTEIEKYGYDDILIIPANLPEEEVLNQRLIETMEETVKGKKTKVAKTFQGGNFTSGGLFAGVKNLYPLGYRIVLTHSIQNLEDHPLLMATQGQNIMNLTGLDQAEVEKRINNNEDLPINFETEINGQTIPIQAQGLSLEEYAILQRTHFEKTGKHLDEIGWTWLLSSSSRSRVVHADWCPVFRRLSVHAFGPGYADASLGSRLSRSFKKLA